MSASKYVKSKGIKSLQHMSNYLGVTVCVLNSWYKRKPVVFEVLVRGVAFEELLRKQDIY